MGYEERKEKVGEMERGKEKWGMGRKKKINGEKEKNKWGERRK